jgi:hypothetical protein
MLIDLYIDSTVIAHTIAYYTILRIKQSTLFPLIHINTQLALFHKTRFIIDLLREQLTETFVYFTIIS